MADAPVLSIEDQLDAWLEGTLDEIGDEPADQEQADRLLWALRSVLRRKADTAAVVAARIDDLRAFQRAQDDQYDRRIADLERLLEGWTRAEFERTGRKTVKLPAGTLRLWARRPRAVLTNAADEDLVAAVRPLLPAAIKVKETVLPGKVKDVTEPGELVHPGDLDDFEVDVPEGYEAREAVLHGVQDHNLNGDPIEPIAYTAVVPGVVLLVPKTGREGMEFSAVTS